MDPSNSFESQASVNTNQPEQTETITCMDRDSYNAAAEGRIEFFKNIINHESLLTPNKNTILHIYITALNSGSNSTTPNAVSESTKTLNAGTKSTTLIGRLGSTTNSLKKILKIRPSLLRQANAKSARGYGGGDGGGYGGGGAETTTLDGGAESTTNFVEEILKKCPSLLWQANAKCETPLHIAARYGHDGIVEVLIEYCAQTRAQTRHDQDLEEGIEPVKELLRMTNKEKDTALHEAVRYNHLEVVKLLISKDPDFSYSANDAGETPLYIAAERGFKDLLFEILDKCKSPMHGGPLGRTALHAALLPRYRYYEYDTGVIGRILETIDNISREKDNNGWTPLHLVAYDVYSDSIVQLLLDKDREVAYMKDTEGRTPLHIAAQRGNADAMKVIVERCPGCCELVDNRGWNVLHFAIKGRRSYKLNTIVDIIIENWSFSNLLNEKNADGDTPLHLYSTTSWTSLLALKKFVSHPRLDKMAFNKQHLNAKEINEMDTASTLTYRQMFKIWAELGQLPQRAITFENDTTKQKDEDGDKRDKDLISLLRNAAGPHLVVAALITTVTFAACITMPGGFAGSGEGSHPGSALLKKNTAFKAFVIIDTISMVLSSSAVFIHLVTPFRFYKNSNDNHGKYLVRLAFCLILGAMITMVLAFVTGTYAVLMHSLDLAIANCIIGLTFFVVLFLVFKKFIKRFIRMLQLY